jgi:hypothetical protein
MSNQLTKKPSYFRVLPCDVLMLIFEFEGSAKENYNKVLNEFNKIMNIKLYYNLAFRIPSMWDDDLTSPIIKGIPLLNTSNNYKFILNQKKIVSYCKCNKACCYQFHYNLNKNYKCSCHDNISIGGLSYTYPYKNKKLTIRKEKTGFCVKINEPSQPNWLYHSSDSNYLSSNSENSW